MDKLLAGQNLRNALGRNIKLFRFHRKLSQADLAEKANISITFLSDIERGNKWPYPETLTSLAKALNIAVYELFKLESDISNDVKDRMTRFSDDILRILNQSILSVRRQYLHELDEKEGSGQED
ncbi:MAG: helix-turn-helix domain-containing protein [Spirochaetaceae bacterium]|jgi:transcriptional regulator with XRE-family HTH domain|nr:helix-turn-helix domain-containing protein [Spirochaetaceae bacterium]